MSDRNEGTCAGQSKGLTTCNGLGVSDSSLNDVVFQSDLCAELQQRVWRCGPHRQGVLFGQGPEEG